MTDLKRRRAQPALIAQLALSIRNRRSATLKLGTAVLLAGAGAYYASRTLKRSRARTLLHGPSGKQDKKPARKSRASSHRQALQRLLPLLLRLAGKKIALLLAVVVVRTALSNRLARLQGYLFRAAFLRRVPLFMRNLLENVALCAIAAGLEATFKSWVSRMELQWRRHLTNRIHAKYFDNMVYYKLSYVDRRIPSVEQRICEDVPALTGGLSSLIGELLSASVDVAFYSWALHSYTKTHRYTLVLLGYVLGVGSAMTVFAPNFGGLFKRQAALEGLYRAVHTRLRSSIESVAFYAGIGKEAEVVRGRFRDVLRSQHRLLTKQWRFGMVQDLLLKYLGATVALVMILGPFFGGHLRPDGSLKGRAAMLSSMRYHTSVTIALFGALGTLGGASRKFMKLKAYAERLAELETVMDEISAQGAAACVEEGDGTLSATPLPKLLASKDEISFEDVTVVTPGDATLVQDLTLRVPAGTNLLVTGPNGAGKSSLFRVLGGLWPLTRGTIRKPGGGQGDAEGGLSHEIFYVPQRPYVSVGTLQEQLLYPLSPADSEEARIPGEKLQALLASVDLSHLLEHDPTEVLDWGEALSLGEQQRLGMARLFFHRPRFAILDECTSAVSVDMERRFCAMVRNAGCTCVTISHRPALMAFHDVVLALDGEGGWSIHPGHRHHHRGQDQANNNDAPAPAVTGDRAVIVDAQKSSKTVTRKNKLRSSEADAVLAGMTGGKKTLEDSPPGVSAMSLSSDDDGMESTSDSEEHYKVIRRVSSSSLPMRRDGAVASTSLSTVVQIPNLPMLSRWRRVASVLLGGDAKASLLGMGAVTGVVLLRTLLQDRIANLNGEAVNRVMRQDMRGFARLVAISVAQGCASAILAPSLRHIADLLALSWRARLTRAAAAVYLGKPTTGYTAVQLAGMADLDQRLTRDVDRLTTDLAGLIPTLVKPVLDVAWFSSRLYAMTGRRGAAILYLYAALGFGALRTLTPEFGTLLKREHALEGEFRGAHSRLRTHAESIAFFGGGHREGLRIQARFGDVVGHLRSLIEERWAYGAADEFFSKQLPHNVTWVLTLLYSLDQAQRLGGTADAFGGDAAQGELVHQIRYLASVVTSSFSAFGDLLAMPKRFAEISGGVTRVSEMLVTLEASAAFDSHAAAAELPNALPNSIEFRSADIATPDGRILARDLDLRVMRRQSLLVTGPNGVGKTSLFRVLSGLWPLYQGGMHRPGALGAGLDTSDIYYVPQKPYATIGTLRDQVIYPLTARQAYQRYATQSDILGDAAAELLDTDLDALMSVVRLSYLVEREGGWDAVREWGETLSLGEQQRLGMARLFFHRPRFGILDECTNATSVDVEEALYQHAVDLGITLITISQRTALVKYHSRELRLLDGHGGWELRRLSDACVDELEDCK